MRELRNREDKQIACGCVARKYWKHCRAGLLAKVENEVWQRPRPPCRDWRKDIPGREHGWDKSTVVRRGGSCMRKQDRGARARIWQKIKKAGIWCGTPRVPDLSVDCIVFAAKGIYS